MMVRGHSDEGAGAVRIEALDRPADGEPAYRGVGRRVNHQLAHHARGSVSTGIERTGHAAANKILISSAENNISAHRRVATANVCRRLSDVRLMRRR